MTSIVTWKLDGQAEICENFYKAKLALSDYYNGRGGAVFGRDKDGEWRRLAKLKMSAGVVYGLRAGTAEEEWFVLRALETRKEPR